MKGPAAAWVERKRQPFRTASEKRRKESAADLLLERLTGLEDGGVARGKLHGLAGGGVAAGTGIAMLQGEGAKAEESNRIAGGDGVDNSVQNTVNNSGGCLWVSSFSAATFFTRSVLSKRVMLLVVKH